jgi:uncharacterized protein (DUF427 family)
MTDIKVSVRILAAHSKLKLTTMPKVTLDGVTLAESADTIFVENNHYFPPDSVKTSLFTDSNTQCVVSLYGETKGTNF